MHGLRWMGWAFGLTALFASVTVAGVVIFVAHEPWTTALAIALFVLLVIFMEGAFRQARAEREAMEKTAPSISQQAIHAGEGARFIGEVHGVEQSVRIDPANPDRVMMESRLDGLQGRIGSASEEAIGSGADEEADAPPAPGQPS